ncbi:MAG: response regulator transcription factor [Bacteroidales bacterium]|nr:response regulator transcription factor [Bacteroidales bacterium]
MKQKILIIDDEQDLCEILQFNLTTAGYQVDTVNSGEEALKKDIKQYDLLLLDVMMPGMSGFELAAGLKLSESTANLPIIFLTALGDEQDKLHGFDLGADDYIAKPFSIREVLARVKAVLSRTSPAATNVQVLTYEGLTMDLTKMTVTVDGNPVQLTKTEYELLKLFLEHRGQVFSRQEVLDKVWPHDVVVTDRTVDVNITRMRKKIGRYSSCIVTRHGFGYLFVV